MMGTAAKPPSSRAPRMAPTRARLLGGAVDGELRHAGHRADGPLDVTTGDDEQRLHELLDGDARLTDQTAERFAAAETARAIDGKPGHALRPDRRSSRALQKR